MEHHKEATQRRRVRNTVEQSRPLQMIPLTPLSFPHFLAVGEEMMIDRPA
jgi:hypothetical protein